MQSAVISGSTLTDTSWQQSVAAQPIAVCELSPWARLGAKLRNPLGWPSASKCLLISGFLLALFVASYATHFYLYKHPDVAPYYNFDFLPFYLSMHATVALGWILLAAASLWYRAHEPQNNTIVYFVTFYGSVTNTLFVNFQGLYTSPYLIPVLGGGVLLLLFFEWRPALCGIGTIFGIYCALTFGIIAEWIPSHPILADQPLEMGSVSLWWIISASLLCLCLYVHDFHAGRLCSPPVAGQGAHPGISLSSRRTHQAGQPTLLI